MRPPGRQGRKLNLSRLRHLTRDGFQPRTSLGPSNRACQLLERPGKHAFWFHHAAFGIMRTDGG
ncbi:hypothetical protein A8B83_16085 [Rhodobacteraceae bacterium EhC02]|nr:hypothetical protein A8B83_16085 [Rhodobacteraceae bacterium EhC02]